MHLSNLDNGDVLEEEDDNDGEDQEEERRWGQ
jgi:hypothetical protein